MTGMRDHTPYYSDPWLTIYGGDVRDVLPTLPSDSVDCVVTSPPYWGLRDYGTATWEGGDAECDHLGEPLASSSSSLAGYTSENVQIRTQRMPMGPVCRKCGATRIDSQLGLERTPEEYVANMVNVFREVRRVLKPSGTCWLNLGDSYNAYNGGAGPSSSISAGASTTERPRLETGFGLRTKGLKPKDLVGIPWRVAFALQADGWYLRSDVIWSKPNPMPESVTDRPTKSHEYLFLLTKSSRYYFDADAVAEPAQTWAGRAGEWGRDGNPVAEHVIPGQSAAQHRPRESKARGAFNGKTEAMPGRNAFRAVTATRNIRSVWTIATRPYPGAHFAVFPPELPERCIKAGCPEGGITLDPFAGSGTVGVVAQRLRRRAVLIDLNPEYLQQQLERASRAWGVGGRRLVDKPTAPPPDSLWAVTDGPADKDPVELRVDAMEELDA